MYKFTSEQLMCSCSITELDEAYPEYLWHPGVLVNGSSSAEKLAAEYHEHFGISTSPDSAEATRREDESDRREYLRRLVSKGLGINDASDDEIQQLIDKAEIAAYIFADMVSRRAEIGWSTHGHSGTLLFHPS